MNNGPKSFKEMAFPPSRDGTNAIYAPLPPAPIPRVINMTEQERRLFQLREMKNFINNERCPICNSQLEGSIGYDAATVYCCVGSEREYKAQYKYGIYVPCRSLATFYTTHFAFEIDSIHIQDELYKNMVFQIDLSLNRKFQQSEKKELLNFEGEKFLLKGSWTEEQLLNKIKLYTLFS